MNENVLTVGQLVIILVLVGLIIYLVKTKKSIDLEKRIGKYTVDPIHDHSISFFDDIQKRYISIVEKMSHWFQKSVILTKYSNHYQKYVYYSEDLQTNPMNCIATKFICSFLMILLALFSTTYQYRMISLFELFLAFTVGFFGPDIYYQYKFLSRKKQLEADMLNFVIIMNNAFKSGQSTMQAIQIVINELDGPIQEEFKKMYMEISFGLSLEVVFKRFADRIKIREAYYIASSITILNETGGNIVNVFNSIEKSLFNKKKLDGELRMLTATARLIVKVLIFLPFILAGIIILLNPAYFAPLFGSQVGSMILILLVCIYICYIVLINKVLKIKV